MRTSPLLLLVMSLTFAGGCSAPRNGDLGFVRTTSDLPRAGNVYLVRGLLGIWSHGMEDMAEAIRKQGVRAEVYQQSQAKDLGERIATAYRGVRDPEPLILVGHSLGADDAIAIAHRLNRDRITVDLLVTVDPTNPPDVPPNVRRTVNLYKSNGVMDKIPAFRGVALAPEVPGTAVENLDLRVQRKDLDDGSTNHFSIDDSEKIHAEVARQVMTAAPDRRTWLARRGVPVTPLTPHIPAPASTGHPQSTAIRSSKAGAAPPANSAPAR